MLKYIGGYVYKAGIAFMIFVLGNELIQDNVLQVVMFVSYISSLIGLLVKVLAESLENEVK